MAFLLQGAIISTSPSPFLFVPIHPLNMAANSADDYTRGYMCSRAIVSPSGNVFWPPPTKLRSTCEVDVTYFPFDDQTCKMKLGSWIYDGHQVISEQKSV